MIYFETVKLWFQKSFAKLDLVLKNVCSMIRIQKFNMYAEIEFPEEEIEFPEEEMTFPEEKMTFMEEIVTF